MSFKDDTERKSVFDEFLSDYKERKKKPAEITPPPVKKEEKKEEEKKETGGGFMDWLFGN